MFTVPNGVRRCLARTSSSRTFPRFPPENEVRSGLTGGGRWIRTLGSARKGPPIWAFAFVYVPETVRVLTQRYTLLGAGGSKSRSRQANGANSRSLENVLASAERPDGASGNRKFESILPPAQSQRRVSIRRAFRNPPGGTTLAVA